MIKSIKIRCPFCAEKSELFLSIDPSIIILNCPECWAPLMYSDDEVRLLSKYELRKISTSDKTKDVQSLLGKELPEIKKNKSKTIKDELEGFPKAPTVRNRKQPTIPKMHSKINGSRGRITEDDIIDLRIALAQCEDIQELIEKI